jgi:hypothetical protein
MTANPFGDAARLSGAGSSGEEVGSVCGQPAGLVFAIHFGYAWGDDCPEPLADVAIGERGASGDAVDGGGSTSSMASKSPVR